MENAVSPMVEKVARAMADSWIGRPTEDAFWTTPCTGANEFRKAAQAAIGAVRDSLAADYVMSRDAARTCETIFAHTLATPQS